jgi:hypothetical protein
VKLAAIERTSLALSAGAAALALTTTGPGFAASLLAGAALESVNFRGLYRSGAAFFAGELAGGGAFRAVAGLRFLVLGIGIVVALAIGAHPVGLVIGLSLVLPAAVIEAWRQRPPVVPDAPALAPDDPEWERWDAWRARERAADDEDAEARL